MIICKYRRTGAYAFIPHVDVLRVFGMAVRRSRADVAFSEGYNPHMQIFLSSPMPLGTESECEYFTAASKDSPADFARKLNGTLPDGFRIVRFGETGLNPAAVIVAAEYEIRLPGCDCAALTAGVTDRETFILSYTDKGKTVVKEVRDKIYALEGAGDTIRAVLGYGNNNLRPDRLLNGLCENKLTENPVILKRKMYTMVNGRLIDADEIFFGGCQ